MKDITTKNFGVWIQYAERKRYSDFQMAMQQRAMFGGNFCEICSTRIQMISEIGLCGSCAMKAAEVFKCRHELNFLE